MILNLHMSLPKTVVIHDTFHPRDILRREVSACKKSSLPSKISPWRQSSFERRFSGVQVLPANEGEKKVLLTQISGGDLDHLSAVGYSTLPHSQPPSSDNLALNCRVLKNVHRSIPRGGRDKDNGRFHVEDGRDNTVLHNDPGEERAAFSGIHSKKGPGDSKMYWQRPNMRSKVHDSMPA